ncbi:COP23 domain-containing protein [Oxynema aestuarii]|uniref:Circadian oscillating protein COP23 n=1 Tax=Oxynema aestuarii AP17 TaxID=2064643 RepID=A0A6H1TWX7_9CYAN|nr:COP23 domain-containing protein [Oxynema aestuarii]QIZ70440.1 hypothetical protein HCG48_07490 [Oxynema aestuarii AP17]
MKLNLAVKTLLATFALSAALPLAAVAESTSASMKQYSSGSNSTRFVCRSYYDERSGYTYPATFATRGNKQSPPLLVWRTNYFGSEYPPERRCNDVTQRFNDVVSFYGGSLQGLQLTHGKVNGSTVLCVARFYGDVCTSENMLFTLRPENARRAAGIVQQIGAFAQGYSNVPPVYESGGEQVYVDLGGMLEPELNSSGSGSYQEEDDFQGW